MMHARENFRPYRLLLFVSLWDDGILFLMAIALDISHLFRTQHHALWLLKELDIEQYEQYVQGTKLQQSGGSSVIKKYEGDIPALPIHVLLDLLNLERKVPH